MDVAKSIIKGLTEAVEYKKGNLTNVRKIKCTVAPVPEFNPDEIKSIRKSLG